MIRRIFAFIIVISICLNTFVAFAANKKASYYDTGISVKGMEEVTYLAIDGQDTKLKYTIPKVEFEKDTYQAFYLESPIPKEKLSEEVPIPEYLSTDKIIGVSLLSNLLDISTVNKTLNLNLTKEEYIAATQVAVSLAVAENSQKYKIKIDSIKNTSISKTAQWLLQTIEQYLQQKPDNLTILEYLYPEVQITINSDFAKGNVEGYFNYFGPYKIESSSKIDLNISPQTSPTNYALVHTIGGDTIDSVNVNEEFYIRFDKKLISDINIVFSAEIDVPIVKSYEDLFFIAKEPKEITTTLVIGNKNSMGTIEYTKFDAVTKSPVVGAVIEVRDEKGNLVDTVTTNEKGVAVSTVKVGNYRLSEKSAANGYSLDNSVKEITIKGNGEVVKISSQANPNTAVVTFLCKDNSTGAPVSGSIFQVINENGNVVEKIGFNETGKCSNIKLESGEYKLKEIFTNSAYELLVQPVTFYVEDGKFSEVLIEKNIAFKYTIFSVLNAESIAIPNAVLELYNEDGSIISVMKTNEDGILKLSLPSGNYFVRNKSTINNSVGKMTPFTVSTTKEAEYISLDTNFYDAAIIGYIHNSAGKALSGVGVVAVDDTGEEYSISVTDFEGKYKLNYLPDNAVIHIKVYKAPYGMTGEVVDNRVIMLEKKIKKDLVLLSIDEFNASLTEDEKIVSYDFYKLNSTLEADFFQDEEEFEKDDFDDLTYLPEPTTDSMAEKQGEIEEVTDETIDETKKSVMPVLFGISAIGIMILALLYFIIKKKTIYKE